jgi:mono/diheme cytochrome c family protein
MKGTAMPGLLPRAEALLCACALACGSARAEVFDRGQALYENHCQSCHETQVHLRGSRHAASLDELRQRVAAWSYHAALGWSAQDIVDVVDYLNRQFYHYPAPPGN